MSAVRYVALGLALLQTGPQVPANYTTPLPPFRIAGNIYYVGTEDLASYYIATAAGGVLIDTGVEETAGTIAKSIEAVGFALTDLRIILTTQAHFDHVGAMAALKRLSGARLFVAEGDAAVIESGGKTDYHFGDRYRYPAARVDKRIRNGEVVELGGTKLTAHLTPGHTPGCTTWTTEVTGPDGKPLHVVFTGSTSVNDGVKLVNNTAYPRIADDYRRTFTVLRSLPCDVFLAAHASIFDGLAKARRLRAGASTNPFIDPAGYRGYLDSMQQRFEAALAAQRAASRK